jgi:hypothetical protein
MGDCALRRGAVQRYYHAAGEPDAGVGGEVQRLVGDANVDRLGGRDAGLRQRIVYRLRGGEELAEAQSRECFARCVAFRGFGEEGAEIQREIENSGGWRSDCATTQ